MRKLQVRFTRRPGDELSVGTLAEERGRVYFEYDPAFLAGGLNLSPFRVPFEPGLISHLDLEFGPLPGLFDDSLPDGWGRLLMDRHFRSLDLDLARITPLDRLAWLGTRTMGALTYYPPTDRDSTQGGVFELQELARQSQLVLSGAAREVLPQLLRAGGSPGGARPKVLVGVNTATGEIVSGEDELPDGYEHWLVKFPAETETPGAGAIEQAYALMAAAAGIDIPRTRLFEVPSGERYFGVQRFDRGGGRRRHVHTFGNLIQLNFRIPSADYADLLKATAILTRNHEDVVRAFRQMVFNVAAHNRDDHVKNFAFLLDDETGEWSLSPAYDLSFTEGPGGEHTMSLAGEGREPGRALMLRLAEQAGMTKPAADRVIDEVRSAVAGWKRHASRAGVPVEYAGRIARALPRLG